ncbi:hypothetical protein U1Q18_006861 [Sarracenia purpurea var. burkii]
MFARRRATNPSFCGTSPRKIGFAMDDDRDLHKSRLGFAMDDSDNGYAVPMSMAVTERARREWSTTTVVSREGSKAIWGLWHLKEGHFFAQKENYWKD